MVVGCHDPLSGGCWTRFGLLVSPFVRLSRCAGGPCTQRVFMLGDMACLTGPHVRTICRCWRYRCEATEDIERTPGTGYCARCDQAVALTKYREPCTRLGRLLLDAEQRQIQASFGAA